MTANWAAVLGSCAIAYAIKLSGHLVPHRVLQRPLVRASAALFPVALLSALMAMQTLTTKGAIEVDARIPAMAAAALALRARWPFIAVVAVAAVVAAGVRALGWMS
ncbi:MAG: AzlD domain-containing protein [Actinobacteria bacterium]|nr:AzlD domain-containing protein [Actinomycetota bacterium]